MLSLICPWHCSHRGTETGAACLSCHLKLQTCIWASVLGASGILAPKMRASADSSQAERASLDSCCQPHLPVAGLAQRHRDWGCLLILIPENTDVDLGSVPCASVSPARKMRTSGDSAQPERASLESCCSASSAHGRARAEAQRLGLLACLAT